MIVKSMKVTPIGQIVSNQDGAIWGKYLFAINGRGCVRVYDIDSFKDGVTPDGNIDSFVLDRADVICPHSNAVCFGSEFYCEGDEFPLLYTNIYNNYAGAPDPLKGVCCVYRIVRDGNKFSSTLVQLIEIGFVEDASLWKMSEDADSERPYGNFVIDRDKNIFYGFTMRSAKSGTRYFAFDLPRAQGGEMSKAYGIKRVVLRREDIKYYFDTEQHYYPQGACCHNSLIYSLEGFNTDELPPRLRIIDAEAKKQIFYTDLRKYIPGIEPELIDFRGDICYYADDLGNLYIMELEFVDDFNTTKADPEIYKMAAARLGRSVGEVVFVDDNINAVKTAKAAGMVSVGIFDDSSAEYLDEFKATADGYVMKLGELI